MTIKKKQTAKRASKSKYPEHLSPRVKAVRRRMADAGLDAFIVTNAKDIYYLTGFHGEDAWLLIGTRRVVVLSDFRFQEELADFGYFRSVIRSGTMLDAIKGEVESWPIEKVGVQAEHMTLAQRKALAKSIGAKRLSNQDGWLSEIRIIKSADEVANIECAIDIQQRAFKDVRQFIKPGVTEMEVAAYLEYRMRTLGATGFSFPTIVAAGAKASLPHAVPDKAKVKKNDVLLIDFGAMYGGYCGDLTRTLAIGRFPKQMAEVYKIVREAELAAIDAIAPGMELKAVDAVARDLITKAGYGEQFQHSLGHGLGLDVHEQPGLSHRSKDGEVLKPGHVVTVEPGIYLPGVGGVRIEDDVLVTENGYRVLSNLPTDIESAII